MTKFTTSLRDWNTAIFPQTLKHELEHLPAGTLPLDKGVVQGGMVDDSNITATILSTAENATAIQAKVGIFFTEIVINCGCGEDPMPTNAYCEIRLSIDKTTAETDLDIIDARDESGTVQEFNII